MWQRVIFLARRTLPLNLGSTALAILVASIAMAQESLILPDFSATEVSNVRGAEVTSKVYRSGANFRADPSPEIATIYFNASDTMYRLMFHGTQCVKTTGIPAHALSSPLQLLIGIRVKHEISGTQVIDRHSCKVEQLEVTAADGKTTRFTLWEATDLSGVPLKVEMRTERGQLTTTYRDIVVGTPDPGLFKPPKNCIPFERTYQVAPAPSSK
jgi:hypothetical protein